MKWNVFISSIRNNVMLTHHAVTRLLVMQSRKGFDLKGMYTFEKVLPNSFQSG